MTDLTEEALDILDLDPEEDEQRVDEEGNPIVSFADDPGADYDDSDFYANIAVSMDERELSLMGRELLDFIERDIDSRKPHDELYQEGLQRTGMGKDAPGGAEFEGASKAVHPLIMEACIDYAARAMKELFPPDGPVKTKIVGEMTQAKLERANRKKALLNWQLTEGMPEFRAELEQAVTQSPLIGCSYLALYYHPKYKRPYSEFYASDNVIIPFSATSFYTAARRTFRDMKTRLSFDEDVRSGLYRDIEVSNEATEPEKTKAEEANDKIEGKKSTSYNEDGTRIVFKTFVEMEIDGEWGNYLIYLDQPTAKVLAIYRNWKEDDARKRSLDHAVMFPMVPWRGALPVGFVHMIGGLSGAATGALRALLDSAHFNNFPALFKLKGGSSGGQSTRVDPTQITEIEGSGTTDQDIRKTLMAAPYNPPSPVLFQLLGFLVDAGRGVVRTTFEDLPEMRADMPVGTTLALIEQGGVVFSSIHARNHDAMARVIKILDRINGDTLDEEELALDAGEILAYRKDFQGPLDVVPVSDPNIFSEVQRMAQIQAVMQRATGNPLYNQRKVEERFLERLRIPDVKDLLIKEPEPHRLNPVNENFAAAMSQPIVAFPDQDHLAHLQVHLDFLQSPVLGAMPTIAQRFMPVMLEHLREHIVGWYVSDYNMEVSDLVGFDASQLMDKDVEAQNEFDQLLAMLSPMITKKAGEQFGVIPGIVAQAMQLLQSMQPQIQDPMAQATMAIEQMKTQARTTETQIKSGDAKEKLAVEVQEKDKDRQVDLIKEQAENKRTDAEIAARLQMNTDDNQTAMTLALLEAETGEKTNIENGGGINPNP